MTDTVRDEFAEWGVKVAVEAQEEDNVPVAACNWESLQAFLYCHSQWRTCGVGLAGLIWIGLDYSACDVVFRRCGFADDLWDDLMFMEEVVVPILNSGDD